MSVNPNVIVRYVALVAHRCMQNAACVNGVFPMSISVGRDRRVGALKLHLRRCVLQLDKLHVSRSARKRSSKFLFSCNTVSFDTHRAS